MRDRFVLGEMIFRSLTFIAAGTTIVLLAGIFLTLIVKSEPSMNKFHFAFIWRSIWNPVDGEFGALPFLVGTLLTSSLAIVISIPFSLAIALLLGEYLKWGSISSFLRSVVELMAGIPSVIYGLWAIFFLVPFVQTIEKEFGVIPDGVGILTASIVLAIMIIPYSASISREVISMVPSEQKEAAYSLGSTRYEVISKVIIPYAKSGIFAGIVLATGRAIGETMAVTMVIGNNNSLPTELIINPNGFLERMRLWTKGVFHLIDGIITLAASLFSSSNTMASVMANEFTEATGTIYISSLMEIGLLLFAVTIIINLIGKEIIRRATKQMH